MNKVDIIIPVHNNFELTKFCIETVLDSVNSNSSKIGQLIIVDDHSTEGNLKEYFNNDDGVFYYPPAENFPPYINFIKPPHRSYFSGTVNYASNFVTSKYMMILSSDTKVYTKEWITLMMNEFEEHKDVGIISPSIVAYFNPEPIKNKQFEYQKIGACCWMMETEYFKQMGGLLQSGKYIHWNSDMEFCERVIAGGKKIGISSAHIQHWGGQSNKFVESHIIRG